MLSAIIIFLAIIPSILLGLYVYKVDKVEKEPTGMLFKLFVLGCVSTIPSIFAEFLLADIFPIMDTNVSKSIITSFLSAFVLTGLVEETVKWCFTYFYVWDNNEFNHIYDSIIYAVFVSLGFATIENILYVSSYGLVTAIIRAIISVPGHAFFAVFMGYYLGFAKINLINGRRSISRKNKVLSLFIPVMLHGIFNFCLVTNSLMGILVFIVFVICLYILSFKKINKLSKVQTMLYNNSNSFGNKLCPVCNNVVETKYCTNCGSQIS